jgi:phage replication-related protein YjqB (UPF0714/DUF867 family)
LEEVGRSERTSTDVSVDVVCTEEHGLAGLEHNEIQEKENKEADVSRELAVQARNQLCQHLAARGRT